MPMSRFVMVLYTFRRKQFLQWSRVSAGVTGDMGRVGRSHSKKQWERRIRFIWGGMRVLWWRGGSQWEGEVGDMGVLSSWLIGETVVDRVTAAAVKRG